MRKLALISCVLLAACSEGSTSEVPAPLQPEGAVPEAALPSEPAPVRDYANACAVCHENGGYGVRVLADRVGPEYALISKRDDLDADTIRAIVRGGIGAMPPMSSLEVSDAELDGIIAELAQSSVGEAP